MKNIKELLDLYKANYTINKDIPTELLISPQPGARGMEVILYGSFDRNQLDAVTLTDFRVTGLAFDTVSDKDIDENLIYEMAKAVLRGNYRYTLTKRTFLDRLCGGGMYLTIGETGGPLLANFRCISQRKLKNMYKKGELNAVAYDLQS